MTGAPIPDPVAQFIVDKIDSVAQLEALLLLRNNPERQWSVRDLAARLYIEERPTAELLSRLSARGFIAAIGENPVYRYQPNSSETRQILDKVAETYSKHLLPVTNLIHSKAKSRIQEFADAFKFRKDE
jgi:hypothetical protein